MKNKNLFKFQVVPHYSSLSIHLITRGWILVTKVRTFLTPRQGMHFRAPKNSSMCLRIVFYKILSQNLSQCFESFTEPKKIIARHFHQYREASNEKHALLNTHTPSTTTHNSLLLQLSSSDPLNIWSPKHLIPETSDPRNIFSSFDLKCSI